MCKVFVTSIKWKLVVLPVQSLPKRKITALCCSREKKKKTGRKSSLEKHHDVDKHGQTQILDDED